MKTKRTTRLLLFPLAMLLSGALLGQSNDSDLPLTEWGQPDLQGTFTYRTITPLQRPEELGNIEILTEEQAAEWAAYENQRQNRDLIIDSVGGAQYPPDVPLSYTIHPMVGCHHALPRTGSVLPRKIKKNF